MKSYWDAHSDQKTFSYISSRCGVSNGDTTNEESIKHKIIVEDVLTSWVFPTAIHYQRSRVLIHSKWKRSFFENIHRRRKYFLTCLISYLIWLRCSTIIETYLDKVSQIITTQQYLAFYTEEKWRMKYCFMKFWTQSSTASQPQFSKRAWWNIFKILPIFIEWGTE